MQLFKIDLTFKGFNCQNKRKRHLKSFEMSTKICNFVVEFADMSAVTTELLAVI